MAVSISLKQLGQRVGEAIRGFAASEGFSQGDIAIAATLDEPTERIYLYVGSNRQIDMYKWHPGILNAIRRDFKDFPSITSKIVMVIQNVNQLEQVHDELNVSEDEIDITELFYPPGQN